MTRYCVQISRFYEVTAEDTYDATEKALEQDYFKGARAQCIVTDLDEAAKSGADSSHQQQGRSPADREAHNLEVGGSIPPPATTTIAWTCCDIWWSGERSHCGICERSRDQSQLEAKP